jgi:hypothetical protein
VKINFTALCRVSDENIRRNEAIAETLGFPWLGKAGRPRLAVIGGGPSIREKMGEIAAFDGDVWAINGAWGLLRDHGIEATFYTIDPSPEAVPLCVGAKKAVIATCCDPGMFDNLMDAELSVAKIGIDGLWNGPTSASTAPVIAIEMGYRELTFYGCESSFGDEVHAYTNPIVQESRLLVACDGSNHLTNPGLFMQAEDLSELIRSAPSVFKEESGGLLRAMVNDPTPDMVAGSLSIHEGLKKAS